MNIVELLVKYGNELDNKLSKDGTKELRIGLSRNPAFFHFYAKDKKVFAAWLKKHTKAICLDTDN